MSPWFKFSRFVLLFSDMDTKLECCIRLSTWTKSHEKENLGRLNLSQATYYLLEYVYNTGMLLHTIVS